MLNRNHAQISLYIFSILVLCSASVSAATITISDHVANAGETVEVTASIDMPGNVLGVAFTLHYDANKLTLGEVTSPFFKTFAKQWAELSNPPNPLPPAQVVVDGITYVRPMVINRIPNGVMIAAANVATNTTQTTLFKFTFTLDSNISDGMYPISISSSHISNALAGYPPEGVNVPIVFPNSRTTVIGGRISVNYKIVDSDGDGIDDDWEILHFNNLVTASATSDFDDDGYSDLQEYLNFVAGQKDPAGSDYDPNKKNAPSGPGYIEQQAAKSNILYMIVPVLSTIPGSDG